MTIILIVFLIIVILGFIRPSRHSGVTSDDRSRILVGDDALPRPGTSIDRAVVLNAPASAVWPWIVQLGKGRSGWYAPAWIEWFVPAKKRGAYKIIPEYQKVRAGNIFPDWGPGSLQVLEVKKNKHIIYGSIKGKEDAVTQISFLFSWALILMPVSESRCRLYIRLRFRRSKHPILANFGYVIGGFFDYLTIVVMFSGLKRRLRLQQ